MEKILLVEDERTIRASVAEILKYYDYDVVTAENGREGLDKALVEKPDLIICDVMMPEMDGYQLLEELKKDTSFNTPFIFLTAKVQSDDIRRGMNLGADDYVFKPFKSLDLINTVKVRLDKKKQQMDSVQQKTKDLDTLVKLMVGHEFNTPMNGIVSMTKFISQNIGKLNDTELAEFCQYLDISTTRLLSTFEKVRKLYEVEAMEKDLLIRKEKSNTGNLIRDIARSIAQKSNREDDLLFGVIEDTVLAIKSNLLFSAVYELIENAFKFSDAGQSVEISAEVNGPFYQLVIKDTGDKIHAEELMNYKTFLQFDRSKYEQQGLGAGLALAMRILEFYDGNIVFSNNTPKGIKVIMNFKL